ncbi:MAG TPA: hypothetical protein VM821_05605 [Abditibacteriaceae bacterium]|nr:hypothetical protein [Abditibacteriaceae bacterium]
MILATNAQADAQPNTQAEKWAPFNINGGEGGQRPNSMAVGADGQWVLCGTDVGGVLQSRNGGKTWAHIGNGFDSYGSVSMTGDPMNPQRAFIVGVSDANGPQDSSDGVFRSTDGGKSWKRVLTDLRNDDVRDRREQLAVDATSFDARLGYCTTIYYAQKLLGQESQSRVFRSTNGGESWIALPLLRGVYNIAVCPQTGALLAGGANGLYRSEDKGLFFNRVLDSNVTGLHAVGKTVAVGTKAPANIYVSQNSGQTFEKKAATGVHADLSGEFLSLKVSPSDPRQMLVLQYHKEGHGRYISHDGGKTWKHTLDYDRSRSPVLIAGQEKHEWKADHVWHPTDPNIVWSTNHDYIVKSDDGGQSFFWSNTDYTGIYLGQGHSFQFNPHNPNYLALSSLDWNGAATYNAGKTWTEMRFRGNWWGWTYACMAAEPGVFFGGAADGHGAENFDLYVTYDNGKTYKHFDLNHPSWSPSYSSYIDPRNKNTWFWLDYRSADRGQSWQKMNDCAAIYTHDPKTGTLYGIGGSSPSSTRIVRSSDGGQTWATVVNIGQGEIRDVALNHLTQTLYIATQQKIIRHDIKTSVTTDTAALPIDQLGNGPNVWSVAADPVKPDVLYVANGAHYYVPDTSAIRSTDGGKSWHSIYPAERHKNLNLRADRFGTGAQDTLWVRVNPETREALFGSNCKGFFKIGPPKN